MQEIVKFRMLRMRNTIPMPKGAQLLYVQHARDGHAYVWAKVTVDAPLVKRSIRMLSLADQVAEEERIGAHVGSFESPDGVVWHVFDGGTGTGMEREVRTNG